MASSLKQKILRRGLLAACIGAAVLGTLSASPYRLGVDLQRLVGQPACLPWFFYVIDYRLRSAPGKGDFVVARMHDSGIGYGAAEGERILKQLAALPGDHIRVEGTDLYINGEHRDRLWLARSIPDHAPGDFDADYRLGENEYFLIGTERESFDSRYWGPVAGDRIHGVARPLF